MKKYSKLNRISSLFVSIAIIVSGFACIPIIKTFAEDTYITKTASFTCSAESGVGSTEGNYLKYDYNNTWVAASDVRGMIPLSYNVNVPCYQIWQHSGLSSLTIYTLNRDDATDVTLKQYYLFYGSKDGEQWYSLEFKKDTSYVGAYGSTGAFPSYKLIVSDLPEGTEYIKLTSNYDNARAWMYGFTKVEYTYKELLLPPEISAASKTFYGAYANTLENGGKAVRDVKITASNLGEFSGAVVTVKKDGSQVNAEDYYNSHEEAYIFSEDGEFSFTAENQAGSDEMNFTVEIDENAETAVVKTVVDDIYNTGKTTAIEKTVYNDGVNYVDMYVKTYSDEDGGWMIPNGKSYMMPYIKNFNGDEPEPLVYAVWYCENGMGSFSVDTFNRISFISDGDFFKNKYAFYASADGKNWNQVEFAVGDSSRAEMGWGDDFISYKLSMDLPDDTKYVKWLSLETKEGYCYMNSIIRASYTTYVSVPKINVNFEDALGNYSNPVTEGAISPSKVKVEFTDVGEEEAGSYTIKKDGTETSLGEDGLLSENGNYEIIASNIKGSQSLIFTIDSSYANAKTDKYVFSAGEELADSEYERLLSITPKDADADFTKGDGNIVVNATAALKDQDRVWWGLDEGGTKLAIGSDEKGYNKDGYFYFVNTDSQGNKYTGISITYTLAIKSEYPTDAYFSIYSADSYNGTYRLVKPSSVTKEEVVGEPSVARYHAVYYFGSAGSVIKVEFHPQAPSTSIWQGTFLSILDITKLSLPSINVSNANGKIVNNAISLKNVNLSVENSIYWSITRDGVVIDKPANGKLTEDGFYTIAASNYAGTSKLSFYLAKKNPAVEMIDSEGNYLDDNSVTDDDVHIIVHNTDNLKITLDGEEIDASINMILDLNGVYKIIAENQYGIFERIVRIERPLPTLKVYNFWGKAVENDSTVISNVNYSIETYDSYTIKLNGKLYTPETEFALVEEGTYEIEAVNKAGSTVISFTIKYNPSLKPIEHTGDTVVNVDYHNGARLTDWCYKFDNVTYDGGGALQSNWTGHTGPILRSMLTGDDTYAEMIYKCAGFKSFAATLTILPESMYDLTAEDVCEISYSQDGVNFTKLDMVCEEDTSYLTIGFKKYRFTALNIPENIKYIKLAVSQECEIPDNYRSFHRNIVGVEFSYNKSDVGKIDIEDLFNMLENAYEGDVVTVDLLNNGIIIPKEVFEKFQYADISLNVNLLDEDLNTEYTLSFNGLTIEEPMDFNTQVLTTETDALKTVKELDKNACGFTMAQSGEWTMEVIVIKNLAIGQTELKYAYSYDNDVFSKVQCIYNNGSVQITLTAGGDYVLSSRMDLATEESESQPEDTLQEDTEENESNTDTSEETTEDNTVSFEESVEEPEEESEEIKETDVETLLGKKGTYIMSVTRKRFVPNESSNLIWVIVLIVVIAVLLIGTCIAIIVLKKKQAKILSNK